MKRSSGQPPATDAPNALEELLTQKQAALRIGVSHSVIGRDVGRKLLRAEYGGIRVSELLRYQAEREKAKAAKVVAPSLKQSKSQLRRASRVKVLRGVAPAIPTLAEELGVVDKPDEEDE